MKARHYLGGALVIALTWGTPALAGAAPNGHKANKKAHLSFGQLDKNHDGVITKEEWRGTAKSFARRDVDHDGKLTPKEYQTAKKGKRRG